MTHVVITESGTLLTESDIAAFEREFDVKLPIQYRNFLLKYNGGSPTPNCFDFIEHGRNTGTLIGSLCHLDQLYKLLEFARSPWSSDSGIPSYFVPIGFDQGGNAICISLLKDNEGQIFFEAHDFPEGQNISFVVNSFDEFLDSLYEYKREPTRRERWGAMFRKVFRLC